MSATQINLTETFSAKRDAYAKRMGDFILRGTVTVIPDDVSMWDYMCQLADLGKMVRVIYRCKDGQIRDMIGRGGVYQSSQDGTVAGIGRPMRSETALTLSFWTFVHGGRKANTGTGKGYRTLRAAGILALRCEGTDFIAAETAVSMRD